MSITIRSIGGADLYVAESASDVRAAVEAAVKSGADLTRANLTGANLAGADLTGAYLTRADLTGAYLTGADLTGAYLTGAYLTGAYLTGADLTGAYLTRADLTGANLAGAKGINPLRVNDLLMLRDQPGAIRAYKLVAEDYRSPIQDTGKLTYAVGKTVAVEEVETDETVQCGAGINLATLPWCMREWQPGRRILLVEFTAADIVAIPIGDGKFRVRKCTVIRELDLAEIGLVPS